MTDINIGAITEAINDKADRDGGNLTATGKENIVALGMPDYTAGVSVSTGTFTAQNDGFLIGFCYNKSSIITIKKEGVDITQVYSNSNYQSSGSITFPVSKNESYALTISDCSLTFYPCKGVI